MKYCLRCGRICAENSSQSYYNDNKCDCCGYKLTEDDMTPEKYNLLSENEKDEYEQNLLKIIQNSSVFDERLYNMYNKYGTSNFYYYFRFDKFEQMTGKKAGRKLTPEEDEQIKQRLDREYGKNSPAYQEAVVQNCINAERKRKQESSNVPRCPICQSTDLKKLGKLSFMNLFGVNMNEGGTPSVFPVFGAKRNDKTWKCNNCGSKF